MKARKHTHGTLDVHAEWYHRNKIEALRAEGMHLRRELQRRGADPATILSEVQQQRRPQERN